MAVNANIFELDSTPAALRRPRNGLCSHARNVNFTNSLWRLKRHSQLAHMRIRYPITLKPSEPNEKNAFGGGKRRGIARLRWNNLFPQFLCDNVFYESDHSSLSSTTEVQI